MHMSAFGRLDAHVLHFAVRSALFAKRISASDAAIVSSSRTCVGASSRSKLTFGSSYGDKSLSLRIDALFPILPGSSLV